MGTTILIVWALWFGGWFALSDKVAQLRREEREERGAFFHTSEVEEVPADAQ